MTLAEYIERDLAERVASGDGLPTRLTLSKLAAHYGVSVTPVRQAVDSLVAAGVLEKGGNRRLVPGRRRRRRTKSNIAGEACAAAPPETAEQVTLRIREDLVRMSLAGHPRFLREEATAERYGVSRSALRNIFYGLAGMGLLDHLPRRGWRLRPFRQSDMHAFLEVREVLELKALDLARDRLEPRRLEQLLANNSVPRRRSEPVRVDNALHAYLIECAGNPYIQDFFDRHAPYYDLLFDWEDLDRAVAAETARQHRAILKALIAKRWSTARKELARHIRDNHPVLGKQEVGDRQSDSDCVR